MEEQLIEQQPKIIFKEMLKSMWFQMKHKHAFKNIFITHNAFGIFSVNSHMNMHNNVGKLKVMYPTIESANKATTKMGEKLNCHFSVYKCAFCTGYHIGKNRENAEQANTKNKE